MNYKIFYSTEAVKQIKKLNKPIKIQMMKKIIELENKPELGKPLGNVLKSKRSLYIGKYRAVYSIKGEEILIAKIEHRKRVYRRVMKRV